MAIRRVRPKAEFYDNIYRGASLTIPVVIKDPEDNPIDLTGYKIAFTIKRVQYDFDMPDDRAYVAKDFDPQEPEEGKFYIRLSSGDTNFEPGQFYFDIQIYDPEGGAVFRITHLEFTLVGGPTNRTINSKLGQLPVGSEITIITIEQGRPIVIISPIAATEGVEASLAKITQAIEEIQETLEQVQLDIEDLKTKDLAQDDQIGIIDETLQQHHLKLEDLNRRLLEAGII
jgi:hypothetical protein